MSNEIQIFNNPSFGQVRVAMSDNNEPMFCLADVCKALELTNPAMVKSRLKGDGLSTAEVIDALGRTQNATFVSEANLYKCIFQSRASKAEQFQDWVCEDVLPSIRKTGGYIATKADDTPDTIMARAILIAKDTIDHLSQQIAEQSARIEADAPKVAFANAIIASKSSCLIGELAKLLTQNGYEIGQNQLFAWMRDNGYLGTKGERRNIPNQRYVEQGLFELKKGVRSGSDGVMKTTITPKVTAKGQEYFINKFIGKPVPEAV